MAIEGKKRLKVVRGMEREAFILGLRLPYLGIYALFFFLSLTIVLSGVSFKTALLSLLFSALFYMAVKFADAQNLLDHISSEKLPKLLINDLYKRQQRGTD